MRTVRQLYLVALATLGWLTIGAHLFIFIRLAIRAHQPAIYGVIVALSFFTILTNIFVATIVTASAWRNQSDHFLTRPSTMSAAVVYIFVVGMVYSLLMRPAHWHSHLQRAVEQSLHDFIPTLYIIYWLIFVPKGTLTWKQPWRWLMYPLLYFVLSLLVGAVTDRYIYSFIDLATLGYWGLLKNSTILISVFICLGLFVVWIDHRIGKSRKVI